jgi:hypothetical protein
MKMPQGDCSAVFLCIISQNTHKLTPKLKFWELYINEEKRRESGGGSRREL